MSMAAPDRFEIPPEMRAFAEKSVEQARQAFDGFISGALTAASPLAHPTETAPKGAKHLTKKAMIFAQQNVANSTQSAKLVMRPTAMQEGMQLQAEYIKRQMQ